MFLSLILLTCIYLNDFKIGLTSQKAHDFRVEIGATPCTDILTKSPDVSLMDFCALGQKARYQSVDIHGHWKAVQEELKPSKLKPSKTTKCITVIQITVRKIVRNDL